MPTIQISILPDMIPVDKYDDEGSNCPKATYDPEFNEANRVVAVEEYDYRDPADGGAFRVTEVCANCAAFNQTEEILECIGDESGDVGYCQKLKFLCGSEKVCSEWAEGGPMTSENQQTYRDNL